MPNVRCVPRNRGTRTVVGLDAAFAHVSARARVSVLLCVCLCVCVFSVIPRHHAHHYFGGGFVYMCATVQVCVWLCVSFLVSLIISARLSC